MTPQELESLRRLNTLIYAEVLHLKKLLISQGVIQEKDHYGYDNSLDDYLTELNAKNRALVKVQGARKNSQG